MSSHHSKAAVVKSLLANFFIGVTKLGASLWTSSGTLMAESIHSFADCGNQVLLMVGHHRSKKEPNRKSPMGYAREVYFWSLLVGVLMFFLGGVFSMYSGISHLMHPEELQHVGVGIVILLVSASLEAWALNGALKALRNERGNRSLWKWFRETKSSELLVLAVEDIAALSGLCIALVALILTWATHNPIFDSVGSMMIGLLMTFVSFIVTREIHALIIGESADSNIGITIKGLAENYDFFAHHLITIQHGSEVMVSVQLEPLDLEMSLKTAMEKVVELEEEVKNRMPHCRWFFSGISLRKEAD